MTFDWNWLAVCAQLAVLSLSYAGNATWASETCVAFESSYHIERTCQCIVYESFGRSQGTFSSVNYPLVYPVGVSCILYTFMADLDEIVELTFVEFDLQIPHKESCSDAVKLFLDLDRPELSDHQSANYVLCGNISSIQTTFYSSTRSLILEFFTDFVQANNTGFKGIYRFLDQSQFQNAGGTKRWNTQCTYDFYSNSSSKSGRFFSPKYPQAYPSSVRCQYYFYGDSDERVEIRLLIVQLRNISGARRCSLHDDVIVIRDGVEPTSPVLRQFCGTSNPIVVLSSGEDASFEFVSRRSSSRRRGFAAAFRFVHKSEVPTAKQSVKPKTNTDPTRADHIGDSPYTNVLATVESLRKLKCDYNFTSSDDKKSGNFSSPLFPKSYPEDISCQYNFQGQPNERIQINFLIFALRQTTATMTRDHQEAHRNCDDEADVLSVTYSSELADDLRPFYPDTFCSSVKPSPLLMSPGSRLVATFSSKGSNSLTNSTHRFLATYTFRSDFGITSGHQEGKGCSFVFRSNHSVNGTFTSPNFGGLYPRNLECHYLFYGNESEKVNVTFVHFNVDGFQPGCNDQTQSDYVDLSNFNVQLIDRKMTRMCGHSLKEIQHHSFISDGSFFRVTFRSNEIYDGTGFKAIYHFRRIEDSEPNPNALSTSSAPPTNQSLLVALMMMMTTTMASLLSTKLLPLLSANRFAASPFHRRT